MARTGEITTTINVNINEEDARKKIASFLKEQQEAINKNLIELKIFVNKDGTVNLRKELKQMQNEAAHGIVIGWAEESWNKMSSDGQKQMQNILSSVETDFKKRVKGFDGFSLFLGDSPLNNSAFKNIITENVSSIKNQLGAELGNALNSAKTDRTEDSLKNLLATLKMVVSENEKLDSVMSSVDDKYDKSKNLITFDELNKNGESSKKILTENSINKIEEIGSIAYGRVPYDKLLKSQKEDLGALIEKKRKNFEDSISNVDFLSQLLNGTNNQAQSVGVEVHPENLGQFVSEIEQYTEANPVKVKVKPEVEDGFELKLDNVKIDSAAIEDNNENIKSEIENNVSNTETEISNNNVNLDIETKKKEVENLKSKLNDLNKQFDSASERIRKQDEINKERKNSNLPTYDSKTFDEAKNTINNFEPNAEKRKDVQNKIDELLNIIEKYFVGEYSAGYNDKNYTNIDDLINSFPKLKELKSLKDNGIKGTPTSYINDLLSKTKSDLKFSIQTSESFKNSGVFIDASKEAEEFTKAIEDYRILQDEIGKTQAKLSSLSEEIRLLETKSVNTKENSASDFKVDKNALEEKENNLMSILHSNYYSKNPTSKSDIKNNQDVTKKIGSVIEEIQKIDPNWSLDDFIKKLTSDLDEASKSADNFKNILSEVRSGTGKYTSNGFEEDPIKYAKEMNKLADELTRIQDSGEQNTPHRLNVEAKMASINSAFSKSYLPSARDDYSSRLSETSKNIINEGGLINAKGKYSADEISKRLGIENINAKIENLNKCLSLLEKIPSDEIAKLNQKKIDNVAETPIDNKDGDKKPPEPEEKEIHVKLVPSVDELISDINRISDDVHPINVELKPTVEELNANIDSISEKIRNIDTQLNQENLETASNSLTEIFKDIPVSFDYEAGVRTVKEALESALSNVVINPTLPEGFKLDINNAQINSLTHSGRSGEDGYNIATVIKKLAEAEEMTQKSAARYGTERSLLFNWNDKNVKNPFVVGQKDMVSGHVTDKQREYAKKNGENFNAYLHTHPYPGTNVTVPTPSGKKSSKYDTGFSGDLGAFIHDFEEGITNQFIATTKEILHMNFDNMDTESLKKVFSDFSKDSTKADKQTKKDKDEYNASYVLDAFSSNKSIFQKWIDRFQSETEKDLSNIDVDGMYENINNYLKDILTPNIGKEINISDVIDKNAISDIVNKSISGNIAGNTDIFNKLSDVIYQQIIGGLSGTSAYNNTIFARDNKVLQNAFVKNGYEASRVKTYSLDEFESLYGNKLQTPGNSIDVQDIASNLNGLNIDLNANIEKLKSDLNNLGAIDINLDATSSIEKIKADLNALTTSSIPIEISSNLEKIKTDLESIDNAQIKVLLQPDLDAFNSSILNIENSIKPINIKINFDELEGNKVDDSTKLFNNISSAFDRVTTNVESNSNRQVSYIDKISESVDVLVGKLKEIGTPTIKDLSEVMKQAVKAKGTVESEGNKRAKEGLQIEKESFRVEQEKEKSKQQQLKTEQENSKVRQEQIKEDAAKEKIRQQEETNTQRNERQKSDALQKQQHKDELHELEKQKKQKEIEGKELDNQKKQKDIVKKDIDIQNKQNKSEENDDKVSKKKSQPVEYNRDQISSLYKQLMQASESDEKISVLPDSFKINNDGFIEFKSTIEEVGNQALVATYKVKDLHDILDETGNLNMDFFNNNIIKTETNRAKDNLDQVEKSMQAYKDYVQNFNKDNVLDQMVIGEDGNYQNLLTYIDTIQTKIESLYENINQKKYTNKEEWEQDLNTLDDLISKYRELTTSKQYKKDYGQFKNASKYIGQFDSANKLSRTSESEIMSLLSKFYGNNGAAIDFTSGLNPNTGEIKATISQNGMYRNVIVQLREITTEAGKATIAINEVYKSSGKRVSRGEKWLDGLKTKIGNLTQYVTGLDMVMKAWNQIQSGIQFISQLDSALTTINQTMNTTKDELSDLGTGAIQMGKNIGSSSDNVLEAASIYANTSETAESVLKKSQPTVMLANASGSDISTVANQIQGVVQQFDELEGQETRIVNSYEKISAGLSINFASGINIMAEGVQNAGSVAEQAGMQFETFAASVGKISERTRQEGSQIGNAYKSILARMSRSKSADSDVSDEDRSNASKAFSSIGISLYNDKGQYKDINDTLDELAAKWDNLTDAQKNYVAEQAAGVRNVNTFSALISTWNDAKKLAQEATEDTDFYEEVQEKHMDSIAGKLSTIQSEFQSFWNSIINTDSIKTALDLVEKLTSILSGLGSALNTIGNATGTGVFPSVLTAGILGTLGSASIDNIKTAKQQLAVNGKYGIFSGVGTGLAQTLSDSLGLGLKADSNYKNWLEPLWLGFQVTKEEGGNLAESLKGGFSELGASLTGTTKAVLGFGAALAAIHFGIEFFDKFTTSAQETEDAVEKVTDTYKKQMSEQKEARSTIDSIGSEWQKLSAGVDSSGNNISLTNDEFERYHEICNQIAGIMPNVIKGYDSQGNAILDLKGNVAELNAEYEKTTQLQAQQRFNENFSAYSTDYKNKTEGMIDWSGSFGEIAGNIFNAVKTMFQGGGYSDVYGNQEMVDVLKKLQNMDYSEARKYFDDSRHEDNTTAELAKEINSILGTSNKTTEEEWKSLQANGNIKAAVQAQEETIKEANNNVKQLIQDYITSVTTGNGEYADLDDNVITAVTQALQNSSSDALTDLSENKAKMMAEINSWLSDLEGNADAQTALTNILGINDNTSIDDIKKMYEEDFKTLSDALGLDEDGVKELKIRLKLDGTQDLINQYDQITKQAQKKADEEGQKQIQGVVKDYADQLGHIDITAKRDTVSGEAMNAAGWSNISKSDADSYFAQTLESDGIQFVLTPVTQDGKQILSPEDLNNYLQDEILKGTDSKNLLLGQFDSEDTAKQVNKFTKEFTKASKKFNQSNNNIKNFLNRNNVNTKQEMNLLKQLMDKYDNWSDVMKNWEAESFDVDVNADSLEALDANLDKVEETIGKINDAYSESITSSGMSKESIQNVVDAFSDLDGYNYDKLFESTASGVHLNTTELAKMNAEYEKHEKSKYADKLKEERDAYEGVCRQISEANTLSEKQELIRKRDSITDQIKQTQELMSRYEGLTNAVTKYQQALQNGEEGDTYDSIVSGYENAMDLWNKGLVGTNEFKTFTQMFSADDLSGKPVADYVTAWETAMPKMERWLSEGGQGVENFLYDIRDLNSEWAVLADDGVTWDLKGLPDMNTLSDALGISQSGIDAIMRKLSDYGFTINFTEETDNLKSLAQSAREAHQELAGFGDLNLDDSDLQKVTGDAERLQAMRDFEFSFDFTDADALDKQIKTADDLRQALVEAYGEGSEKVELFDKQLDYIKAKQGEMADMSSLAKSGLGLGLDMEADAETLNDILKKLTEINNFKNISLKFDTTNIDSVNSDLATLEGKIKTLKGADGKVDMNADGASELMELYSAELNQKSKLTQNSVISDANTSNLKSAAQRDAITYLQEYQKVSAEYQNAVKVNNAFGEGTIDLTNLENNVTNVFSKISNAGDEVKDVFKNIGVDISKIDLSNLTNSINGFNGELNEITKADYSGIGGSLTSASVPVAKARYNAIEAIETLGSSSLNIDANSVSEINAQIDNYNTLKEVLGGNADAVKALNAQFDYLNQKKSFLSGDSYNLDLNYNDNKEAIDSIVDSLKQVELYEDFTVDFKTNNEDEVSKQISDIYKELEFFKDPETGQIDFTQNGASQLMDIMQALINKQIELKNNSRAYMNVDTSGMDASHQNAINNVRGLQNSMDELQKAKYMNALNPDFDTSSYEKAVSDAWKKIQSDTENKKLYTDLKIEPNKVEIKDNKVGDEVQEQIQGQLDNVSCEVLVDAGYDVKNIDKLKEDLQFLNDKYNMNIDIDWENQDPKYLSNKIEDLKEGLKELVGEDGVIKIGEEGYAQAKDTMLSLIKLKQQAEGNVVLDIDTSQLEGETQTAVEKLQEIMQAYQDLKSLNELKELGIDVDTSEAEEKVSNLVSTFNAEHPTMAADVGLNIKDGDPEKIATALEGITPTMMVNAGVDEQLVKDYKPEDKDADVNYHVNKQEVTTFLNTNIDKKAWVVWHNDTSDLANNRPSTSTSGLVLRGNGANVNGTAHVNGTAYAGGNWGAKKDETALVGELGSEIKVDSRTGQWSLLGANGAEFADIHKGDIIFNHKI